MSSSSSHQRHHRHHVLRSFSEEENNVANIERIGSSHAALQTGTSNNAPTINGVDAVLVLASSHAVVPMDGTETKECSSSCHPVITSLELRHQEESSDHPNNSFVEEVVIEEDDAKSTNRAVSCAGEEEEEDHKDYKLVQELQSIEEESDYEYDYEDDEDGHFTGFLVPTEQQQQSNINGANVIEDCQPHQRASDVSVDMSVFQEEELEDEQRKVAWKEPSQAAVTMSLRAEREKCGGKRRLASDLYKIMMGDTSEQGFTMEPTNEDSMEKWKIKLFGFHPDSNLQKDMVLLCLDHVELEMSFPNDYPFAPPFVRVVRPRFKRQTGFVMNGALCMELLTNEGWNPVNDIESVIVSIRSLLVVGDGRLSAAVHIRGEPDGISVSVKKDVGDVPAVAPGRAMRDVIRKQQQPAGMIHMMHPDHQRERKKLCVARGVPVVGGKEDEEDAHMNEEESPEKPSSKKRSVSKISTTAAALEVGSYSEAESKAAYSHLSDFHKKKGWDSTGWWARKG